MKLNLGKIMKSILVALSVFGVVLIISCISFLRQHYNVPILMYHSVGQMRSAKDKLLTVSPDAFERQMKFLKQHNYNVISLRDLAGLMKAKRAIPYHTIIITFDDGYRNNFSIAFPILKKYNIPATIFVAPKEISSVGDYLDWNELKELSDSPLIEIGSHSLEHAFLIDMKDKKELIHQIKDSKEVLEEHLNVPVDLFSYPSGGFSKQIRQIVIDSGYQAAVATKPGLMYPDNDIFALKRIRMRENDNNYFSLRLKLSGFYVPIREWQRREKDAGIKYYE